ncbi:hypothetical protein [Inquilinus sp. CA228]
MADKWARQRQIILRSLARRLLFLAGIVVLALVIVLVRFGPWG